MNIYEYAKRAAIRRIVYIAIAAALGFIASFYSSSVKAQTDPARYVDCRDTSKSSGLCEYKNDALTYALLTAQHFKSVGGWKNICQESPAKYRLRNNPCEWGGADGDRVYRDWDKEGGTLCPPGTGPKPGYPGECLTRDECLAKNNDGWMGGVRAWEKRCLANGCEVAFDKSSSDYLMTTTGGRDIFSGTIKYTGNVCTAPENWNPDMPDAPKPPQLPQHEQDNPPKEECVQAGTQTACVKPNGDMCAKASTGREICWSPGETGTKTDKNVVQQKKPGDVSMPPSISIDNGDTADKSKDDVKIVETFPGGRTATTTLGTYETATGANAGSNQGQNSSSGSGNGSGGDGDGNGNSSSGGGDCSAPPVSSGDALLTQIAHQQWLTRCGTENTKGADLDAAGQFGAEADGLEMGLPDSIWDDPNDPIQLDSSHVAYGSGCPAPPQIGPYAFAWPNGFCNAIGQIRLFVIALAYLWSIGIVARR